jgi:DNA-binding Xre family transcriptional regulator
MEVVIARRRGIRLDPERFDYALSQRALTARKLAELAGIQEETLSRARHGATLRESTMRKITEALLSQPLVIGFDLLIARPDRGEPE